MITRAHHLAALLALTGIAVPRPTIATPEVASHATHAALLRHAESRFRAIYERDEFRPKRVQAEWLPDSSGYTVFETAPGAKEPVRARYDVVSGTRSVVDESSSGATRRPGVPSPDRARSVVVEQGNLFVRGSDSDP